MLLPLTKEVVAFICAMYYSCHKASTQYVFFTLQYVLEPKETFLSGIVGDVSILEITECFHDTADTPANDSVFACIICFFHFVQHIGTQRLRFSCTLMDK